MAKDEFTKDYAEAERPPVGSAYLEVVRGASQAVVPVKDDLHIGRDSECEARFGVAGVSRRHARIIRKPDGTLELVDLGSHNGTFLNGRRIKMAVLRGGDQIRVGPVVLVLQFAGETDRPAEPSTESALDKLTAREREIATLVVDGLTNAEIAARLGISPGTVGRHLANIYERLDIHSRAALAALAAKA